MKSITAYMKKYTYPEARRITGSLTSGTDE
jgi:hypothetical protein